MKKFVLALTALSLIGGVASPSIAAAACRDKNGKFIKCPAAKPKMCRDRSGHFAKCK